MMNKIGIVTLPLHFNYGGILQAYALQQVLKKIGYDAVVIGHPKNTIKEKIKDALYKFSGVYKFINANISIIRLDVPFSDEAMKKNNIHALVVGSDQVWRPCMGTDRNENVARYFLKTEKVNIRKVAYAASFGVDYWDFTKEETEKAIGQVKDFDAVSVRESSGIDLCVKYLNANNVVQVLDPTMLLHSNDYRSFTTMSPFKTNKKHCFVYLLDYMREGNKDIIKEIVHGDVEIHTAKVERNTIKKFLNAHDTVEKWLSSIYYSDFVITDSFHGCVFSILFHKEFYVMGNVVGGNARIVSLLNMFGLQDRFVDNTKMQNVSKIDWEKVDRSLDFMRKKSITFLKENLS